MTPSEKSYMFAPRVIHPDGEPGDPDFLDYCTTAERARELGELFIHNCQVGGVRGYGLEILRREVGPWEVLD